MFLRGFLGDLTRCGSGAQGALGDQFLIRLGYTCDPYGNPDSWGGSRYRYTGQLTIPEAHLYYYKARIYDPFSGRFLQTDPVGYDADVNLYAYANNDPVNGSDPSGMATIICQNCEPTSDVAPVTVNGNPPPPPPRSGYTSNPAGFNFVTTFLVGVTSTVNDSNIVQELVLMFHKGKPNNFSSALGPPSNTSTITCASPLPNGKTVGDMVQELNQRIAQSEDKGNVLSGALTFYQGVNTGGILDFKNTMRGQGYSGSYLAAAGNFAYGAAAADYFGNNPVGAQLAYFGGAVYAVSHFEAKIIPPGTIFTQDVSGAKNIGPGFKSGGC